MAAATLTAPAVPSAARSPALPSAQQLNNDVAVVQTDHPFGISDVAWMVDGRHIVTGGKAGDCTLRVFEAADDGVELRQLQGHGSSVSAVGCSPGGDLLSSSWDGRVCVWPRGDEEGGGASMEAQRPVIELEHTFEGGEVDAASWSPDGSRIATGAKDGSVRVWEVGTQRQLGCLILEHSQWVNAVRWDQTGTRLLSSCTDGTVQVWEEVAAGGSRARALRCTDADGGVQDVCWSPDGSRFATALADGTVGVWDAMTGGRLLTLVGHARDRRVTCVDWSPNGTWLASGSNDCTVRLWDAATGRELCKLTGHTNRVTAVRWSPDGSRLASASTDATVWLWGGFPPAADDDNDA